ncbi:DUF1697 domain-containing protein [Carnobacterium antarcticum]|uniref:DUF1697 domain-containing protein n=1 Tax=Carnobacterium antarcticum TaxID=2126436 RepID=A0ABW4NPV1_9LACT|nr:DUF1697 domain-containing protein [Carnobacterium sp. CP1]ALV22833.1 hypothetical protein NY10_2248 [Carnobacterium sp. CP1]
MRFIILLRGVNVGGKNRVPMGEFKEYLVNAGFTNVKSHINSGNLIVDSEEDTEQDVLAKCQKILSEHFDFPVEVLVLSAEKYQAELADSPAWWGAEEGYRHNALFLLPSADKEKIIELLAAIDTPYERIHIGKHAVFWSSSFQKNYSKTHYSKLASRPYYKQVTIRNRNTTLKLLSFLEEQSKEDK